MIQKLRNNEQGFTLIELMIVIAIIGILAAIAIPNFIQYRDKSYCSKVESDVHNVSLKANGYLVDHTTIAANHNWQWSNGVSNGDVTLTANGTLTVYAEDESGRCPKGKKYTIIGGQDSGDWSAN